MTRPAMRERHGGRDDIRAATAFLSASKTLDEAALVAGLGRRLRDAALPIDRLVLYRWTLHPDLPARAVSWAPNRPIEIHDRAHGWAPAPVDGGALQRTLAAGEMLRIAPGDQAWMANALCRSLAECLVLPIAGAGGPLSILAFGTARPGGFVPAERAALGGLAPALRSRCAQK